MYRKIIKKYGADNVTVIGNSYGGLLAMQLLTWINRNNADEENERIEMPELLIMNSPFGYPKTDEERPPDVQRPVGVANNAPSTNWSVSHILSVKIRVRVLFFNRRRKSAKKGQ